MTRMVCRFLLLALLGLGACTTVPQPPSAAAGAADANRYAAVPAAIQNDCTHSTLWTSGQYGEAAAAARRCLAYPALPLTLRRAVLMQLSAALRLSGDHDGAVQADLEWFKLGPAPDGPYLVVVLDCLEAHRYDDALATLDTVYRVSQASNRLSLLRGPYYVFRGRTLLEMRRPAEAVAALTNAIGFEPGFAAAYRLRGEAYEASGNAAAARADYVMFARWAAGPDLDAANRAKLLALGINLEGEQRHPFGARNPLRERALAAQAAAQRQLAQASDAAAQAEALKQQAVALDDLGQRLGALDKIDHAMALATEPDAYAPTKVTILLGMERADEAIRLSRPLITHAQRQAEALGQPDRLGGAKGEYDELLSSAGAAYLERGEWDLAERLFAGLAATFDAAGDVDDRDYVATLYLYLRAKSGGQAPANGLLEQAVAQSHAALTTHYRRELLLYWQGQASVDLVLSAIQSMPDAQQREMALAETWFLVGGYQKYVKHDEAAARECLDRLNALEPFGMLDWTLARAELR
jgi:hypothetical protein